MSSLASAPRRATSESGEATPVNRVRRFGLTPDAVFGAVLAAALAVIVFVATGGTDLGPNTWIEIAIIAVAAGCAVALVVAPRPRSRSDRGAVARSDVAAPLILFAALAALTYASIAWSVQPADSWIEANRTLSYLAAFGAAAALARLAPARWRAVAGAIGTVAVVACGYALLTKVFPATLNAGDAMGRLRAPFDYWNATGLMAALGLPVCLWAGARPRTARVVRSVSVPATAILFTALVLSFSRGAVVAAVIGLAVWFALAPFRLRGALVLVLGAVGAALATFWALSHHPITHDNATLTARTAAGHRFGLVLLAVVVLSALIGVAATFGMERIALRARVRRQIGMALVVLVALVPFVALAGAAASSRGLTGEISHAWHALTSSSGGVGNNPNRLGQLGNSRPIYWREGLKVGEHAPLAGVGAGGFDTARTRYTTNSLAVAHAHSYLIETFADLGLIGVVVSLALLGAWALTCRRALRPVRSDPAGADERAGLITLLAVAVTFGISSLLDWTWFVPGVAVPALVSAGWLVGRGSRTAGAPVAGEATQRPLPLGRAAAGLGIVVALFVAGWFVWQPLHSADQVSAAIDALTHHNTRAALGDARSAAASDPVSVDPLWELSAIYSSLGDPAAARHELVQATRLQPSNPQTWQQLGSFDLLQARRPRVALSELETAQRLDRTSAVTAQLVAQARRALGA